MGKFGNTLASTIASEEALPNWLQFETHPEDGEENMYESAYYNAYDNSSVWKMTETRGVRQIISKYINEVPEEERSWERFNDDGYNTLDIPQSEYKTQMRDVEKGYYNNTRSAPSIKKDETEEVESRPVFDPDAADADPLLVKLMKKKSAQADAKVNSLKETVEEKYYAIYDAAKRLANGRSLKHHVFICGDAGVGKSYMVGKAVEVGQAQWRPNKRDAKKPEFLSLHGSIGTSMTNILIFFWKNREGKLILLDDADGFILNKDQDVQNFLKACLDPDMHPVTSSPTIRAKANKILELEWAQTQKKLGESIVCLDTSRLHEGKMACSVNGNIFEWDVSFNEAKELFKEFGSPEAIRRYKESKKTTQRWKPNADGELVLITESTGDPEDGMSDEEAEELERLWGEIGPGEELLQTEMPEIPQTWQFSSSLMMISNLRLSEVNDAVRSRCQCVELTLTRPEFLYRAESIIDKINVGDDSSVDPVTIEWAKKESFAIFKTIVGATSMSGTGFDDVQINIPLEFRLIATMTGAWLARYDRWCEANGIENPDSIESFEKAEEELMVPFIDYDLKKILAGDTRPKKRRA